jgi:hypothetical protein
MLSSMAAKEKISRLMAWLAPILLLLAALAAAQPASALTCGALETRAWEKTSAPLESRSVESLQLLEGHQSKAIAGYNDALGSPLAAENAGAADATGKPYDIGLAKDLRKNPPPGQVTQVNHAPQSGQAESLTGDFNPANKVGNEPAIRLPTSEHEAVTAAQAARTAPASARDLLASDLKIMRKVTEAPNAALKQLVNLVKETHPWDYLRLLS